MNFYGILILLLGHVLGDFYFQSDKMAEDKKENSGALLCHAAVYAVCMGISLLLCAAPSFPLFLLLCTTAIVHALIDHFKILLNNAMDKITKNSTDNATDKTANKQPNKLGEALIKWFNKYDFFIDQAVHLITIFLLWISICRYGDLDIYAYVGFSIQTIPLFPLLIGLLCLIKPSGMLVGRVLIKYKNPEDDEGHPNAGRLIGYLERIIVFILIVYQQYGAIAFVIAAKSLARFQDINDKRQTAEYYLIGTLLSVATAFAVALLLGFCSYI